MSGNKELEVPLRVINGTIGLVFDYLNEGWRVNEIKDKPGQPSLQVGDTVLAIGGKFLHGRDDDQQEQLFRDNMKHNALLTIVRKVAAKKKPQPATKKAQEPPLKKQKTDSGWKETKRLGKPAPPAAEPPASVAETDLTPADPEPETPEPTPSGEAAPTPDPAAPVSATAEAKHEPPTNGAANGDPPAPTAASLAKLGLEDDGSDDEDAHEALPDEGEEEQKIGEPEAGAMPLMNTRTKDLYRLVCKQLAYDGFHAISQSLSAATGLDSDEPANKLFQDFKRNNRPDLFVEGTAMDPDLPALEGTPQKKAQDPKLESLKSFGKYEARFVTMHKSSARVVKFSRDGKFVATASEDRTIKLLDVAKMHYNRLVRNQKMRSGERGYEKDYSITRPVIRTFHDHEAAVNDVDFHPDNTFIASAGKDGRICFWDVVKPFKRASHVIEEAANIRSIHYHPSGDYLLAGGDGPMVRLYDANTLQGFLSRDLKGQHQAPLNMVRWATESNIFATCGKDGSVKIWDGLSFQLVNTIKDAHGGEQVDSVMFSANTRYLLTSGRDSTSKLWDMSSGKVVIEYTGAQHQYRTNSCFSWDDKHVLGACHQTNCVVVWDTCSGNRITSFRDHQSPIKWVSASPSEAAFMTASMDSKARFWAVVQDAK